MRFRGKFAVVLGAIQLVFIVAFFFLTDYDLNAKPSASDGIDDAMRKQNYNDHYFPLFEDIHALVFFGIGFLLTFTKKYGYTGLSMNMLLAAISIQVSVLVDSVWNVRKTKVDVNLVTFINGEVSAASVLIALGGIFGKASALQMVFFAVFETIFYAVNDHLCISYLQVADLGESVSLHLFCAVFGLSVAYVMDRKKDVRNSHNDASSYVSNIFCLLGTVFLFVFWPCFNSALATGDSQQRSAINTFLALLASCVTAFATSSYMDKEQKFNMTHIQNATLAGGVAVGTVTDLMITPAGALAIGSMGGVISVFGYAYFSPFLARNMNIYDPCGINSLHGLPGIFSGITGAIVAAAASQEAYGYKLSEYYPALAYPANHTSIQSLDAHSSADYMTPGRSPLGQAGYQLAYVVITMVSGIVAGLVTGLVLRMPFFEPLRDKEMMYTDDVFWKITHSHDDDDDERPCTKCSQASVTKF